MGADFYGSTILVSGCGSWRASGLSFRLTWSETTMLSAGKIETCIPPLAVAGGLKSGAGNVIDASGTVRAKVFGGVLI